MDKVIILGIYDFLGFGTCKKLLEDGIQVQGFRFFEEELEEFMDEKKLLIGRNANFEEGSLSELPPLSETDDGDAVILISFYDFFYMSKENAISLQTFSLFDFVKCFQNQTIIKLVCLFPSDFLEGLPEVFQQQLKPLENEDICIQSIFLPTIYGPWQPEIFLFQQCFVKDYSNIQLKLDQRENTTDAIYIDDVVEEIIRLMKSSERNSFLITSEKEGNWRKCAQYLKIDSLDPKIDSNIAKLEQNYQIIKVKEKTSFQEGLSKQKKHLLRLINQSN